MKRKIALFMCMFLCMATILSGCGKEQKEEVTEESQETTEEESESETENITEYFKCNEGYDQYVKSQYANKDAYRKDSSGNPSLGRWLRLWNCS